MASSKQKIVLVTGCSTGIGLSTAVIFAKDPEKRFKVYATMRNLSKKDDLEAQGKELLGRTLFIEKLDVTSEEQINKFVDDILAKEGSLDVLVNNAGIGWVGPTERQENAKMEAIYATNVFGPIKLVRKLIPVWKKSGYGRAITVTSIAGISGFPFNSIYASTKFAMEGFSESVQMELACYPGIKMITVQPGPVFTKFSDNAEVDKIDASLKGLDEPSVNAITKFKTQILSSFKEMGQQGEDIAKIILEAATSSSPHSRYMTNPMYAKMLESRYSDLTGDNMIKLFLGMYS